MRLSDAIMLGSTLIKWIGGVQDDGNGGGCALGMANRAVGATSYTNAEQWPWAWDQIHTPLPCTCTGLSLVGSANAWERREIVECRPVSAIVHIFNYHVMRAHDWSLERLVDWVRSIEPAEVKAPVTVAEAVIAG